MQQVKKQLQDAIAELKSEWGINEVKREDLAAVLDKVVAALDRAAQLPVVPAPAGRDFNKHFFRVVVRKEQYTTEFGNADGDYLPTVLIYETEPARGEAGFFDPQSKKLYRNNINGSSFDKISKGRMLYNRKIIFRIGDGSDNIIGANGLPINGYDFVDDLNDPNWEF